MAMSSSLFLVNGTRVNWEMALERLFWGLPSGGHSWEECQQALESAGFRSGSHIVACAGPLALFRAVVEGSAYFDDTLAWPAPRRGAETYPVRFKFGNPVEIRRPWFITPPGGGYAFRSALDDVYLGLRSLFVLRRDTDRNTGLIRSVLEAST
jgi:hypothetical protein